MNRTVFMDRGANAYGNCPGTRAFGEIGLEIVEYIISVGAFGSDISSRAKRLRKKFVLRGNRLAYAVIYRIALVRTHARIRYSRCVLIRKRLTAGRYDIPFNSSLDFRTSDIIVSAIKIVRLADKRRVDCVSAE